MTEKWQDVAVAIIGITDDAAKRTQRAEDRIEALAKQAEGLWARIADMQGEIARLQEGTIGFCKDCAYYLPGPNVLYGACHHKKTRDTTAGQWCRNFMPKRQEVQNGLTTVELAAYDHVESIKERADHNEGSAPSWHGWAIREAFQAGAEWAKKKA